MNKPIHEVLSQLGDAISAQLTAANDRAASAEREYIQLRDGLRALVFEAPASEPPLSASTADVVEVPAKAGRKAVARSHGGISDESLLDALSPTWQTAHTIRKGLIASGLKIAFGTVYSRLDKLAAAFPDLIETDVEPARWRLRTPNGRADGDAQEQLDSDLSLQFGNLPRLAITDVRERLAGSAAPKVKFEPEIHLGNCFEIMKSLPDQSVDLILTDPPYSTTGLDIDPTIDLTALLSEYRRVIKSTGSIVMFGSQPFSSQVVCAASDIFKHDLIWVKNRATGALHARNRPLKQHEDILVFSLGTTIHASRSARRYTYHAIGQTAAGTKKTGKPMNYLRDAIHKPGRVYEATTNNPRSTLFCPKDEGNLHPFQKPLDLLEYLIRTYSNEGDVVLDTFMGSGSTCVAAQRAGRRSIGIELSEKYFKIAEKQTAAQSGEVIVPKPKMALIRSTQSSGRLLNDNQISASVPMMSSDHAAIYNGDCLEVMRRMPSNSIDLIFTSPPYNLGRSSGGGIRGAATSGKWKGAVLANGYASYDDARDPDKYIAWQKDVLRECWRLLRDDGAIYYNHKPRVQNGLLQTPLDLNPGLPVRQIVIWNRKSGLNFNRKFYLPSHEWIVIFAKPDFSLRSQGASGLKDVWTLSPESSNKHPAPFPVELARMAIETTSSQVILDPFMGSGSTGVAALKCARKFIGIELDPGYCNDAAARMGLNEFARAA